jgi:energy-coupling factor transport system permease protein
LSPEIKIIAYILFIIVLFFIQDMTVYLVILAAIPIVLLRIPLKSLMRGWIPITIFLVFTFTGNALFQQGRVIFNAGPLVLTDEGLTMAFMRTTRLFIMIAGAKLLTATTKIELLVEACGNILKPLEFLRVPVREFFSIMALTVKSLPELKNEIIGTYKEQIKDAGITGFWNRARLISQFLMPLFVKTIQSPERFFKEDAKYEKD